MASIMGIELKNVKTFRGQEYPTNYHGNVYYNGKKQGFWSQDGWGGPDRYEFNTKILDAIAKSYYGKDSYYDLDCLLGEILTLRDYESIYKKAIKAGYTSVVIMSDGFKESYIKIPRIKDKTEILKQCDPFIKRFTKESKYKDKIKISVFTDLEDFIQ